MTFEEFIGPSSTALSPYSDLERTMNLFLETGREGGG